MVEITIANGRIRELEAEDLPAVIAMSNEKDIQELYFVDPLDSLEKYWQECLIEQLDLRAQESWIRPVYNLPIETHGRVKGILTIHVRPYVYWTSETSGPEKHHVEIGYFIAPQFRKQGIATEVLKITIPYSFRDLNAGGVGGTCLKENDRAQRLLKKAGLEKKWEGICKIDPARGKKVAVWGLSLQEYNRANATNTEQRSDLVSSAT